MEMAFYDSMVFKATRVRMEERRAKEGGSC